MDFYYYFVWFFAQLGFSLFGFYGPWFDCILFVEYIYVFFAVCAGTFADSPWGNYFLDPKSLTTFQYFVWFCSEYMLQRVLLKFVVCFILSLPPLLFFSCHFSRWVACAEWHVNQKSIKMFAFSRSLAFTHVVVAGFSNCGKWISGCFPNFPSRVTRRTRKILMATRTAAPSQTLASCHLPLYTDTHTHTHRNRETQAPRS